MLIFLSEGNRLDKVKQRDKLLNRDLHPADGCPVSSIPMPEIERVDDTAAAADDVVAVEWRVEYRVGFASDAARSYHESRDRRRACRRRMVDRSSLEIRVRCETMRWMSMKSIVVHLHRCRCRFVGPSAKRSDRTRETERSRKSRKIQFLSRVTYRLVQ